ncbi:alpha/beta fold hydrolase [Vibrio viridaestus]|uniref:Alpha/beta hydrolase n=1 Tax=Vibrio viridaestus TaxID=2487322 RepID=A0A3N9TKQ8_9VIBR|nr:alpha/beta hydrolase [Vibrio viridaestus]RQW64978.1 alpha/beta hydrolase [Vibrio viridaestus]
MQANLNSGLSLEYQILGEQNSKTLLMIQGLSMQLIDWPEEMLEELSKHFKLIIFDNRDIGYSTKMDEHDISELRSSIKFYNAQNANIPYTLFDMAQDAIQLMDYLDIDEFSVLGFSMGGKIAQIVAALNPKRVKGLVSLMSSGGQSHTISSDEANEMMQLSTLNADEHTMTENMVKGAYVYAGSNHTLCEKQLKIAAEKSIKRGWYPDGVYRQGLASRFSGDRSELLKTIGCPTLFIHGDEDPCISIQQAKEGAELITGSRFIEITGQGHDFPPQIVPVMSHHIIEHLENISTY